MTEIYERTRPDIWSRLKGSRLAYRVLAAIVVLAIVIGVASSFTGRSALGVVVDACRLNASVTGSPFPCLKVVSSTDAVESFAVLREPAHDERTIVTPLMDIPGIEDRRVWSSNVPNYFASAWNERSMLLQRFPSKDDWQDVALAINSALNRTQDHLHIHMGCVLPEVKEQLNDHRQAISATEFRRLDFKLVRRTYWARFIPADMLAKSNPFALVAKGVPGAGENMGAVTMSVIGAKPDGRLGFYVLAEVASNPRQFHGAAEDLLDPQCRA